MLAAFHLSGVVAPYNLADILVTGLAILGFLAEPFKGAKHPVTPLWFKVGIPGLLIIWISFTSFARFTTPLTEAIPFLMEARPLLYLLVAMLWMSIFPPVKPMQISFWSGWLALLICIEFGFCFFAKKLAVEPNLLGNYMLTGPILLTGLCATLHTPEKNRFTRFIILAGIFCSLGRDISFAAVTTLLLFGPRGMLKKMSLVFFLMLFNYISLIPQEMTLLSRNDLPNYWIWFSMLELLANNPVLLLTGFPASIPLPLNVPASLWNIWHGQHYVWTDLGIYLFHVNPLWLHIITAWGLGGICIVATIATSIYRRFPSNMMAALLCAIGVSGFFSPLFYYPATAIVLFAAFISAAQPEVQSFKFE